MTKQQIEFVTYCCYNPSNFAGYDRKNLLSDFEIIKYLYKSIQKHHSDSLFKVITNRPKEIAKISDEIIIIEKDIDPDKLMYERTKCYVEYIDSRNDNVVVAFLDADCLLVNNIYDLVNMDFDLALTCRKSEYKNIPLPSLDDEGFILVDNASPINGGAIFSRCTPAAKKMWQRILKTYDSLAAMGEGFYEGRENLRYSEQESDIRKWGGDQFTLMSMFGKHLIPDLPDYIEIEGVRILFLDRAEFNATPIID